MTEHLKTTLLWLTASGIKIIGILVALFVLWCLVIGDSSLIKIYKKSLR